MSGYWLKAFIAVFDFKDNKMIAIGNNILKEVHRYISKILLIFIALMSNNNKIKNVQMYKNSIHVHPCSL